MKDHTLFFVPGILGTELFYEGPGLFKEQVTEPVWTEDLSSLWDTMAKSPGRLHRSIPLLPGKVLRSIKLLPHFPLTDFYDRIYRHLTKTLSYSDNADLIMYGYDWRQSNITTAARLAIKVRALSEQNQGRLKFIAHSMGGLIVRLMLADPANTDIAKMTTCFIQIGTPVRGSSKAFHTLKKSPTFNSIFDAITRLLWTLDPITYKNFMDSLQSFESLFELFPPDTEQIVSTRADDHLCALDQTLWPMLDKTSLDRIRQIQTQMRSISLRCLVTIYSSGVPTEREYIVDRNLRIIDYGVPVWGDGSVSVASAALNAEPANCRHLKEDIEHDALPNHDIVLKLLDTELSRS